METRWNDAILQRYPGAYILDSSLDEAHQTYRHLVCHNNKLFFVSTRSFCDRVWFEGLNRDYGLTVKCDVQQKK